MDLLPPIIPVNPESSETIAKIQSIATSELGGEFQFYRVGTCGVAVCECDFLTLHFHCLENSRLNFSLEIQVINSQFEVNPDNPSLEERIGKALTPDDAREFIGLMAHGKLEGFKQLDIKNLGIDKQGAKELLANLTGLIPFQYAFPWAPGMVYERENGRTVTVFDRYCTNPDCPCTESLIEVTSCDGHPFEAKNKAIEADFFYDYKEGHIPSHDKGKNSKKKKEALAELRSADPKLDSFLKQRHKKIHQLVTHLASVNKPMSTEPQVGRNSPCPCGSGKKYKKCCV